MSQNGESKLWSLEIRVSVARREKREREKAKRRPSLLPKDPAAIEGAVREDLPVFAELSCSGGGPLVDAE